MIAGLLESNSQTCTPKRLLGTLCWLFAFKGVKKKVEKMRKETWTNTTPISIYCLAFQVPTFRISSVLYLIHLAFSNLQCLRSCLCLSYNSGISVFVPWWGLLFLFWAWWKKNLTICRLCDLYIIVKEKGSHITGALSHPEGNSEVLNISLHLRAFAVIHSTYHNPNKK